MSLSLSGLPGLSLSGSSCDVGSFPDRKDVMGRRALNREEQPQDDAVEMLLLLLASLLEMEGKEMRSKSKFI